jgi:hypothetical protein
VVSVAILVGPALALVTFVRVQRWAGARRMPHDALRLVLRGALVALLLVAAAIGATLLATLTGQRSESWGPATPWLVVGAVGTGISVIVAAALLSAAARNVAQPESRPEPTDAPDALDDLVAFFERLSALAHVRASRLGRAIDTVPRTLRAWLDSPRWSPRRHPVAFPAVLALVFGISFSGWHAVTEGTAWTYGGLLVSVFYAGVAATIVLMSYALLGRYLRLVHTLS